MKRTPDLDNPAHESHVDQLISTNGRVPQRVFDSDNPLDIQVAEILTASCRSTNKERCGFITQDEDIFYVYNIHKEPTHNFLMDSKDFQNVIAEIYEDRQTRIVGIFHTHPNNVPWPTPRDLVGWPNPALGWRYWIVTGSEVIEWRLTHEPI
jgi:proteasome lid subunit RPN8/RPN11